MIGPILALAIAASAPQSTTPRDGILNGGFEGVLDVPGKPMRTGFWVVGEEDERSVYIPQDPGGYYLELQRQDSPLRDQIAYQMVGCPLDKAETAEITGWVYLPNADSEARVSVSAAGADFWSLHWVTKGTFFRPGDLDGYDLERWEVWQAESSTSTEEQFTYTTDPDPQANAIRYKFIDPSGTTTAPNNSLEQKGPTRLQTKVQSPAGGYIEVRWIAPRDGWTKVMNRPYFLSLPPDDPDFDLKYEIYHDTTLITSVVLEHDNQDGIVLLERVWVEECDEIRFRASKNTGMSGDEGDAIFFDGQPVVAYEGNTVTYRIGVDPAGIPVSDTDERSGEEMKNFRDLQVWQKAHALALAVYRATSSFPQDERFALSHQLRRAAVSISANIAEGCGRSVDREFARFLQVSLGSASEVQSLLLLARDLGFLEAQLHAVIEDQVTEVKRMLAGLLGRLQSES